MRRFCGPGLSLLLLTFASPLSAGTLLSEGFNNITTLPGAGWAMINNSAPIGPIGWFQGNDGVFVSQAGASTAYIAANYLNADPAGGNISDWLITPELLLDNGAQLAFFTRTENPQVAADRLEVRLSTSGASTNVGATDSSVGDFTALLLTVNPTLNLTGYPNAWTQFTATVSGLGGPTNGRFAFRYFVVDTSVNGDYIGIDTVQVDSAGVPEPATMFLIAAGLGVIVLPRIRRGRI